MSVPVGRDARLAVVGSSVGAGGPLLEHAAPIVESERRCETFRQMIDFLLFEAQPATLRLFTVKELCD